MKVLANQILTHVPVVDQSVDSLKDLPYIPSDPLPKKNFSMYICGFASSGKTTLMLSMLLSHPTRKKPCTPRFYYRYFDKIFLFSPSRQTLPLDKLKLDESRIFDKYSDEALEEIIDIERDGENHNNLIIIDDSIKQIKNRPGFHRLVLNRRHITHNNGEEGQAGLSIIVMSQKYNALDLIARTNMSDVILFRTENRAELNAIKAELMADLSPEQQDEVLRLAWDQKYSFLLIKAYNGTPDRYYRRFDKIVIKDDEVEVEEE
tara:strand:+ start:366 stop:1151 length:786 start_codon:yes stop_codon:yes gene_type:complete